MKETARLLRDLVQIPSINPMGRELDPSFIYEHRVTDYLERLFNELGAPCERQAIVPQRENILAHYKTDSPRTILWEVHQDTVPVDQMTIDPFCGTIENGKLYGRGSCDVKGGMASMLGAFSRLVREKPSGSANVILACTVDEEHTFLGVQRLAKEQAAKKLADFAVVAEPTELEIVKSHKGTVRWTITTKGRSCHSSQPDKGINAIYHMARVLGALEQYAADLMKTKRDSLLGSATLSVGRIGGGVSVNTVPDRCVIEVDRRLIPGETPEEAHRHVEKHCRNNLPAEIDFEFSEPWLNCPALSSDGSEEAIQRLGAAIDAVIGQHKVQVVPYGTDASTLANAGLPSIVFGPGSIAQAHTCDEHIDLEAVEQASEILYQLAVRG